MLLALRTDAIITAIAIAAAHTVTLAKGDVLFIGRWYYASVFLAIFVLSAAIKTKPLFISGATFAAVVTFVVYLRANWEPSTAQGLLALGHLFSLPGAAIGLSITGIISRHAKNRRPALAFTTGVLGFATGFLVNQIAICGSVLACGVLLGSY